MFKKIWSKVWPELKLLPLALLVAIPFAALFGLLTKIDLGQYWIGYVLSIVGFYLVRLSSYLVFLILPKAEEWVNQG